jgi:hypothetical protein
VVVAVVVVGNAVVGLGGAVVVIGFEEMDINALYAVIRLFVAVCFELFISSPVLTMAALIAAIGRSDRWWCNNPARPAT